MDIFEHFKNTYHKEVERRATLNGELTIPIGLITVLATGIFYYLTNFDFSNNRLVTVLFVILLLAGSVLLGAAVYFLLESYNITHAGQQNEYDYLAYPDEQRKYYNDLKAVYIKAGNDDETSETEANKEFEKYLLDNYINATTKNTRLNDTRSAHLFTSKRFILWALIVLIVAFIPFGVNFFVKAKPTAQINATKSVILLPDSIIYYKVKEVMSTTNINSAPKPVKQPVSMPKPPENRHIKEGQIPTTTKISNGR